MSATNSDGAPDRAQAIVLTLHGEEFPTSALRRAWAIASMLGTDLHVLRVMPARKRRRFAGAESKSEGARERFRASVAASRTTQSWFARTLDVAIPRKNFKLRHGDFASVVRERANALSAAMIVMSPSAATEAGGATLIARQGSLMVLVAREASPHGTIVAATDLSRQHFPVLRRASELSQRCEAPLVAVHNASPPLPMACTPIGAPLVMHGTRELEESRLRQLRGAARALSIDVKPLVSTEHDPARGILSVAERHGADVIVIGTPERPFLARLLGDRTAEYVVRNATGSVMLVPVAPIIDDGPARTPAAIQPVSK